MKQFLKKHKVLLISSCTIAGLLAVAICLYGFTRQDPTATYKAMEYADKGYLTETEIQEIEESGGLVFGEEIETEDGTYILSKDEEENIVATQVKNSDGESVHEHIWKPITETREEQEFVVTKAAYTTGEWITTGVDGYQCSWCKQIFDTGEECWAHQDSQWTGKEWNTPGCCWAKCVRLHKETTYVTTDHPAEGYWKTVNKEYTVGYVCDCGATK